MENYFSHLEGSSREALQGFSGTNDVRVYPRLAPIEWYGRQYEPLAAAHAELKEKYSKLWFPFLPTPWAKRLVRAVRLIYRLLAEPYFIVRAIFRRLSDLPELSAMATGQRRLANAPDVAEPPSGADGRHPTQSRGANPGFAQSANQPAA